MPRAGKSSIPAAATMRDDLIERADFLADPQARDAHDALLRRVFDLAPARGERPRWVPFALFDHAGACVAAVEAAALAMVLDGKSAGATGIRLAAVDPRWRGQGLFRALMTRVLAWCATAADGPVLLYTEDEGLYGPHGFRALPQHVLVGPAPALPDTPLARDVAPETLDALLDRLLPVRVPVSGQCAIVGADDLLRANLRAADGIRLAWAEALDALIAYEVDADRVTIVDVVAAAIPSLAAILGALPERRPEVATMFPTDRLAWRGRPVPEETGLMIRGPAPAAMRRPFMLPPTVEF